MPPRRQQRTRRTRRRRTRRLPANRVQAPEGSHLSVLLRAIFCPECPEILSSQEQFKGHLQLVHGLAPYPCLYPGCSEAFQDPSLMGVHCRDTHPQRGWRCPRIVQAIPRTLYCKAVVNCQQALNEHIEKSHQRRIWGCSLPGCVFLTDNKKTAESHTSRACTGHQMAEPYTPAVPTFPIPAVISALPPATLRQMYEQDCVCRHCFPRLLYPVVGPEIRALPCGCVYHTDCLVEMVTMQPYCYDHSWPFIEDDDDDDDSGTGEPPGSLTLHHLCPALANHSLAHTQLFCSHWWSVPGCTWLDFQSRLSSSFDCCSSLDTRRPPPDTAVNLKKTKLILTFN